MTGLDISRAAIDWATERAGDVARFIVGDAVASIPGEFEIVIDGHCLHCIIGADRQRLLANISSALVPGGALFVSTMCGEITSPALRATFDPASRCQIVDGVARRYIGGAAEILDELRAAGFDVARSAIRARIDDDDQEHLWVWCARR